jgi:hypothetical protein
MRFEDDFVVRYIINSEFHRVLESLQHSNIINIGAVLYHYSSDIESGLNMQCRICAEAPFVYFVTNDERRRIIRAIHHLLQLYQMRYRFGGCM